MIFTPFFYWLEEDGKQIAVRGWAEHEIAPGMCVNNEELMSEDGWLSVLKVEEELPESQSEFIDLDERIRKRWYSLQANQLIMKQLQDLAMGIVPDGLHETLKLEDMNAVKLDNHFESQPDKALETSKRVEMSLLSGSTLFVKYPPKAFTVYFSCPDRDCKRSFIDFLKKKKGLELLKEL